MSRAVAAASAGGDAAEIGLQAADGNLAQGVAQQFVLEVFGRTAFAGADGQRKGGGAGGKQAVGFFNEGGEGVGHGGAWGFFDVEAV